MFKRTLPKLFAILLVAGLLSCSKDDGGINIFSVQDDITFGQQADQEIRNNPQMFPILDSATHVTAYQHLYRIRNTILASGKLNYAETFGWRCFIIQNDTVINAFCLPGGSIYFYTGIIKLLDNEAQFAGVMAHEMAHADRRHATDMLTVAYGVDLLLAVVLGNNTDQLVQIATDLATGLGGLAFSRQNEYAADEYAVRYLYPTELDAASLGDFFLKVESHSPVPVFLSTHPSPEDRLEKINEQFQALGGVHGGTFAERYQEFQNSLP